MPALEFAAIPGLVRPAAMPQQDLAPTRLRISGRMFPSASGSLQGGIGHKARGIETERGQRLATDRREVAHYNRSPRVHHPLKPLLRAVQGH